MAAAVVGAVGAAAAFLFRQGVNLVQSGFFFGSLEPVERAFTGHGLGPLVIAVPILGASAAVLLLYLTTRSTRGAGATTLIQATSFRGGTLPLRDALAKAAGAVLTLGTGGSAGREGPILQLGGAGGSALGRLLSLERADRRILIACGAIGGLAATFNAPVAAVVFAIEAIYLEFRTESFVPMVVASVFGTTVGRILLGDTPTFDLQPGAFALSSPLELGPIVVLGVAAGLFGVAFLRISEASHHAFEDMPVWARPLVGGTIMGGIGFAFPQLFGVGYSTMQTVLDGSLAPTVMGSLTLTFLVLLVLKPLAVAVTLGGGGSGGVFSPTLFVGIMLGAVFGLSAGRLVPGLVSSYPVYAVVGMVAVFAAVSRATLTGIILAVEFTHTFEIVVPAMLAAVIADVVAWALHPAGLYETQLREEGVLLPHDLSPNVLDMVLVEEIMSQDVEVLRTDTTVKECLDRVMQTGHGGYPILDDEDKLVGVVTRTDLRNRPEGIELDAPVTEIMTRDVLVARPGETVHKVFDRLVDHEIGHIPVVAPDDPRRVVGWVTKTDVMRAEVADERGL